MPKQHFDEEICRSADPKIRCRRSQDCSFEPYDLVVKVREGWVDLEPVLLVNWRVAKWIILL
jgi:hypothetical protein